MALKEVNSSENILKSKTLLKSNCDLETTKSTQTSEDRKKSTRRYYSKNIRYSHQCSHAEQLDPRSVWIQCRICRQKNKLISDKLIGGCINVNYIKFLSRKGLLEPSIMLTDAIGTSFVNLHFFEVDIQQCPLQTHLDPTLMARAPSPPGWRQQQGAMMCPPVRSWGTEASKS